MILSNAQVTTLDPRRPHAEAVALEGGTIRAVGSLAEVGAAAPGPELDLGGAWVYPGLVDSHGHLQSLGELLAWVDLGGARSPDEAAGRVAARRAVSAPGAWVRGRGWDQNLFPGAVFPRREELDRVAPDRPVLLERIDGHAAWVNSLALRQAGISRDTRDPEGGRIVRDASGEPTGILVDRAMELVTAVIPEPDDAALDALLLSAAERLTTLGLTGVHDAGLDWRMFERLERLALEGRLPLRVYGMARADLPCFERFRAPGPCSVAEGRLTLRGAKFFVDGALGSRGAALFEDYSDEPGNRGLLLQPDLKERVRAAVKAGFQPALHAIGDRGNALALDALEGVAAEARPRIEHAQVVRAADLPRFAGRIAAVQPIHAVSDRGWAERRLGPRLAGAYAWRALREAGAVLTFGSDFPIEDANPLLGIVAATARQDARGEPAGGWRPEQGVTRAEALEAYTVGAAYAAFEEGRAGRIAPGMRADLSAFDCDLLAAPASELRAGRAVLTVVAGQVVYRSL